MKTETSSIQKEDLFWPEEDTYLYLGWVDSRNISGLAISSSPLCISHVIESDLFTLLDFFTSNCFTFSSEFFSQKFQSQIERSSVIVLKREKTLIVSNKYSKFSKEGASVEVGVSKDIEKEKICPLRHLLLLSKTLNKKQLNSFRLAIKYGFPAVYLVDFRKKTIKTRRDEITSEWNSMVLDQKGSLQTDFVRTLKSALKSLENEHHPLFEKIYSIIPPGDHLRYSLAPLFTLLPYTTMKKSKIVPIQPKIGIKSLRFETIFELEEENISNLVIALEEELSSEFLKITVNEMGRFQPKSTKTLDDEHYRVRISIILEVSSKSISLEDSTRLAKEFTYRVIERALYNISNTSYEKFRNRKIPEFWLKSVAVAIEIPFLMLERTEEIIRNSFGSDLDPLRPMKLHRRSAGRIEIVFNLYYNSGYDYVIDGRDEALFPDVHARDPYTKIGIDHLMRKQFSQAINSFRKAKSRLIRDYFNTDSFSKTTRGLQLELINKLGNNYSFSDLLLEELISSASYTNESNPKEILYMLEITNKWLRTTIKLRDIDILERQIRFQDLSDEERAKNMSVLHGLISETEFRFFKNFFNFIEDIGSFYVDVLQKTEERAPESVKEWMRLSI